MFLKKIRPIRGSIRFRITGLFVGIFGSTLIAFSALLYSAFTRNHQAEFDADLYNHAVDISHAISIDVFGNISVDSELLSTGGKIFPFSVGRAYLQILSGDGKLVARSRTLGRSQLPLYQDDLQAISSNTGAFRTIGHNEIPAVPTSDRGMHYRLLTFKVTDRGPLAFILQIAVSVSLLEQERRGLLLFFLISIPFTLVIAAIGGWYVSGSALAPVMAIIEKAKSISSRNLSERLPVSKTADEVQHLSITLNELLNRLEQAFESQERFIADASHELKTPLAIMRGELDVLKSRARSQEEVGEFVESAAQELKHLSRLVEDLLLLARVDAGAGSLSIQPVRLDEILLEVVARMKRIAKARDISIRLDLFTENFDINGDPNLLQSLFQNLIDNAIKFSPPGSTVDVSLCESESQVREVSIRDRGAGIAPELLPRIFDRFYRAKAKEGSAPGFGLGLTIARRIAEAHGATLQVQSSPNEGTTFTVVIKNF